MKEDEGFCPCPLDEAMEVLGSRWTLSIVVTVGNFSKLRFRQLKRRLTGISSETLSRRLKASGRMGVLRRESYPEVPPTVEYSLTDEGQRLREASIPLMRWASGPGGQRAEFIRKARRLDQT